MSRSCQSATFSSPTSADGADDAREAARSAPPPSGCACAASPTSPSCPVANGSSTSRTSVRARWRISVAKRSSDVATSASVESSSAWRSRAITCVETGSGSSPSRSQATPLDLGVDGGVRADRARELADAVHLERAREPRPVAVELERPAGELPAEGRRLGVDPVRAADADRVPVLLRTPHDGLERAVELGEDRARRPSRICSESAVSTTSEDVSP